MGRPVPPRRGNPSGTSRASHPPPPSHPRGDTGGSGTREFLAGNRRPFLAKPFTLAELTEIITKIARSTAGAAT